MRAGQLHGLDVVLHLFVQQHFDQLSEKALAYQFLHQRAGDLHLYRSQVPSQCDALLCVESFDIPYRFVSVFLAVELQSQGVGGTHFVAESHLDRQSELLNFGQDLRKFLRVRAPSDVLALLPRFDQQRRTLHLFVADPKCFPLGLARPVLRGDFRQAPLLFLNVLLHKVEAIPVNRLQEQTQDVGLVSEAPVSVDFPSKHAELVLHVVLSGEQVVSAHVLEFLACSQSSLENVAEQNHIGLGQSQQLHRLNPIFGEGKHRFRKAQQHRLL